MADGTKTVTYDEKTAMPKNDGCTSALESFKNSQTGYTCEQVGGAANIPEGMKQEDMEAKAETGINSYKKLAEQYASGLSSANGDVADLENMMDTCQNMFDSNKYAAEPKEGASTNPDGTYKNSEHYALNPSVSFNYMQVYLDGTTRKGEWQRINYEKNDCQYKFSNTAVDDIDDQVIYYSKKFGEDNENMRDMEPIFDRVSKPEQLSPLLDNTSPDTKGKKISKKFRRDAQYEALCTWSGEDVPNKITLYPGPIVSDHYEAGGEEEVKPAGKNMNTQHKYQYALYLTTYRADYETYWELTDLGGSNRTVKKFMKYFNGDQAKTCADFNSKNGARAYSDGKEDSPEHKIKEAKTDSEPATANFTCVMTAEYGGMRIGSCNYGVADINDSCTDNEVKEVFEFKVVDPGEMFPGDWTNKAQNWKKEDGSWGQTYTAVDSLADVDKTYAPESLTYSYKLDTNAIKAIKNYNKDHPYTYDQVDDPNAERDLKCVCPADIYSSSERVDDTDCGTINKPASDKCTTEIKGKTKWKYTCRECKSDFLYELSVQNKVGDKTLGTTVWNNSVSFKDIRDNNHWA